MGVWRQRFVGKLALFLSLLAASPLAAATPTATRIYEEGRRAERAGQMARAYLLYSQAAALDPTNQFYWLKSQAVQSRAALESPPKPRDSASKAADAVADPSSALDELSPKDRSAERNPQPPVWLKASTGPRNFDLRADSKSLWVQVARAFGLDTVFDGDYTTGPAMRF